MLLNAPKPFKCPNTLQMPQQFSVDFRRGVLLVPISRHGRTKSRQVASQLAYRIPGSLLVLYLERCDHALRVLSQWVH